MTDHPLRALIQKSLNYFSLSCIAVASAGFVILVSFNFSSSSNRINYYDWTRIEGFKFIALALFIIQSVLIFGLGSPLFRTYLKTKYGKYSGVSNIWYFIQQSIPFFAAAIFLIFQFSFLSVTAKTTPQGFYHTTTVIVISELVLYVIAKGIAVYLEVYPTFL